MANILPFHGTLYSQEVVGDIRNVVAPPYDVIDTEAQKALHARHPNNVIRLELGLDQPDDGPSQNRYTRAASLLRDWLARGALRRDPEPAIYPYRIEYRVPSDEPGADRRVLKGFLSLVELEEFGTGRIFPHENTRSAAKTDRLKLLETCRAHFSPIFSLFSDREGTVNQLIEKSVNVDRPRIEVRDDAGFRHQLWAMTDRDILHELTEAMQPNPLFIADGHHRYEAALTYRRLRRRQTGQQTSGGLQPYEGVLMLFSSLEDPGLTILPTHRVLNTPVPTVAQIRDRLRDRFEIEAVSFTGDTEAETRRRFLRTLRARGQTGQVFGLALRGVQAFLLLGLRPEHRSRTGTSARDRLDVSILHSQILSPLIASDPSEDAILYYTKDDDEALDWVRQGTAEAALLLNPTKVSEVQAVAAAGDRMPHKSTYFFPKPLTGLVINVFEE
ncbi:MAG: DUF1015 domain-containing protein [Nitrospiraceae bacterium]